MPAERMLTPVTPADVSLEIKDPVDATALGQAKDIIAELRTSANGAVDASKLLEVAKRLGDVPADHAGSYTVSAEECKAAKKEHSSTFSDADMLSKARAAPIAARVRRPRRKPRVGAVHRQRPV